MVEEVAGVDGGYRREVVEKGGFGGRESSKVNIAV